MTKSTKAKLMSTTSLADNKHMAWVKVPIIGSGSCGGVA